MNQEAKQQWVTELRSGNYQQTNGYLRRNGEHEGYCCLGVLCELAVQANVIPVAELDTVLVRDGNVYNYGRTDDDPGSVAYLPRQVRVWAELGQDDPLIQLPEAIRDGGDKESLAGLNDSGFTFDQIADMVENLL
jgi:hypothetical protein